MIYYVVYPIVNFRSLEMRPLLGASFDFIDLAAVFLIVALTDVLVLTDVMLPFGRLVLIVVFLFVLPGYVWIAALQPGRTSTDRTIEGRLANMRPIGIAERIVLAVGLSVALVATIGFVLYYTNIGVQPKPTVEAVTPVTIVGCLMAVIRRLRLRPEHRFGATDFLRPISTVRGLFAWQSSADQLLSILLVVSLAVIILGSLSIAVSTGDRASYTELYLLSENESGADVAAANPENVDTSRSVVLGIGNHERGQLTYSVIVQLDRPGEATGTTQPLVLDRLQPTVESNETREINYTVPPGDAPTGSGSRVTFLLYKTAPPAEPDRDTAYRSVYFWLNASSTTRSRA